MDIQVYEMKIWLLVAVVTTVGGILIAIVKGAAIKATQELKDISKSLNQISVHLNTHEQQIINIGTQNNSTTTRLNDHSVRIRHIEQEVTAIKTKL